MNTIQVSVKDKIAIITLNRGRSNAINAEMVRELIDIFKNIELDTAIHGVILTGKDGFFSAGLDLIELYDYDQPTIKIFWGSFMYLVEELTRFKKPFISAISGHSPAGGCVLALCSDFRIMAEGKFIIGLNEVPVGLIVPESIFSLYAFWLGHGKAYQYLLEGRLLTPLEAQAVGLVDEVVNPNALLTAAERQMKKYIQHSPQTWQQTKLNLRKDLIKKAGQNQPETLEVLLKQWWAPTTRSIIKTIIQNLTKTV